MFVEQLKYCRIGFGNTGELIIGPIMTSQMLLIEQVYYRHCWRSTCCINYIEIFVTKLQTYFKTIPAQTYPFRYLKKFLVWSITIDFISWWICNGMDIWELLSKLWCILCVGEGLGPVLGMNPRIYTCIIWYDIYIYIYIPLSLSFSIYVYISSLRALASCIRGPTIRANCVMC